MTAEESTPGYPRWKWIGVDVLSELLLHLLVPPNHSLVKLWQVIDWRVINRLCADAYHNARSGQRAWAPAQLIALLVLFFVLPVRSECALLRLVAIVPLYRWFCGFALFSALPDHSTLYTFRRRIGAPRFEAILTWVVLRCQEQGLIANELLYFDMTAVAASAHAWTPHERAVLLAQALIRYLERSEPEHEAGLPLTEALQQLAAEIAIEVLENKRLNQDAEAPSRVLKSLERWTASRQEAKGQALWEMAIEEIVDLCMAANEFPIPSEPKAQRRRLKALGKEMKALLSHARGDQDARIRKVSRVRVMCGYWLGFLVDGAHAVITAVQVVPLNAMQHRQLPLALEAHQQRVGHYPEAVAADSAQDYYPLHQVLDTHHIQGHIASRKHRPAAGGLDPSHFTWNEAGQLLCPEQQVMVPGKPGKEGKVRYVASGCVDCARKEVCLPKTQLPGGRRIFSVRPFAHQRWHQNRAHTQTLAYKQAQSKRFASEGLFGLAKRLHGADKMPYRSTEMNQTAGLMIGIVMNLMLLTRLEEVSSGSR
jgi:transposase